MNQPETPNSRLFILGGKGKTEEEFREIFGKYGEVKDVWILKDKRTNEDKGVIYITYAKASMAALAREEMNAQPMPGQTVPLKVMIANDRREGSVREPKEDDKNMRIFIKIPKSMTEKEVEETFKEYGDVEHVNILREKGSGDPKGLAYVKYTRAYHAALAVENCDKNFKAIFAARKVPRTANSDHGGGPMDMELGMSQYGGGRRDGRHSGDDRRMDMHSVYNDGTYQESGRREGLLFPPNPTFYSVPCSHPQDMFSGYPVEGETRLEVIAPSMVTQEQLFRLFDLVPGLDFCDLDVQSGVAYVKYANAQSAAYARDKLNGFEYPPSYRLSVRYRESRHRDAGLRDYGNSRSPHLDRERERDRDRDRDRERDMVSDLNQNVSNFLPAPLLQDNIQTLVNSIKKATSVLTAAGMAPSLSPGLSPPQTSSMRNGGDVRVRYCSTPLPEKQALLPRETPVAERLFIVSQPEAFTEQVLVDCFCRFGNLIDAYFMPSKNYGYAKYGCPESAKRAIDTMHSQTVCGQRLKVMRADPPKYSEDYDSPNKRPRS